MIMRRILIASLAALLAACGSSSAKPDPGAPTSRAPSSAAAVTTSTVKSVDYGAIYERLVKPVVDAEHGVSESTDIKVLKPQLAKVVAAIKTFDAELLKVTWPADVAADVHELVSVDGASVATLEDLKDQTNFSINGWWNQLVSNFGRSTAASAIVRADLGLPPKK